MNSVELIDKKEQLRMEGESIISGAEKELRKLTDEETNRIDEIKNEIDKVDDELRKINENLNNNKTEKRTMENFSLIKAIKQ